MENKGHITLKTLWEKKKLLVTSNFSFSHNVFHHYISLVPQNAALWDNGSKITGIGIFQFFSTNQIFPSKTKNKNAVNYYDQKHLQYYDIFYDKHN